MADFRRVWNEHCAPLPRMLVEPASADAKRLISLAWKAVDGDAQLLGASIDRAAKDGYYSEHRYTFPTFCRHLERWLDDQAGKPVAKVEVMPSTNGVRDQVLALLAAGDDVDPGGWRPEQRAAVKAAIAEFRGKRPR